MNGYKYLYKIESFDNYDGDSFNLTMDIGFNLVIHRACRLFGADTPEMKDKRPDWRAAAELAQSEAELFIADGVADGTAYFESEHYAGKYGRPLGNIVWLGVNGQPIDNLRDMLMRARLAVVYYGENKSEIESEHQANIDYLKSVGKI